MERIKYKLKLYKEAHEQFLSIRKPKNKKNIDNIITKRTIRELEIYKHYYNELLLNIENPNRIKEIKEQKTKAEFQLYMNTFDELMNNYSVCHCVNIKSDEFYSLLDQIDTNSMELSAKIGIWQDKNKTDDFPSAKELIKYFRNDFLRHAQRYYSEKDYEATIKNYNYYLSSLNFETELDLFYNIKEEYINSINKANKLNISETNTLFIKFEKIKQYIAETENFLTETEENVNKLLQYELLYTIHWGNYSEDSIIDILQKDPRYILWCIINLEHFAINNVIFLSAEIRKFPEYIEAIEINQIKQLIINKWDEDVLLDSNWNFDESSDFDDIFYDNTLNDAFEGDESYYWNID